MTRRTALLMKGRLQSIKEEITHNQSRHQQRYGDRPNPLEKDIAVSPIFCNQLDLIYLHNYWAEGTVLVGEYNYKNQLFSLIQVASML